MRGRRASLEDSAGENPANPYHTMNPLRLLLIPLAFCFPVSSNGKEIEYNLTIARQVVDVAGKPVTAMTVNGGIPGPVLGFTEGDTAVIRVHNAMDVSSSIHWHGMLVPPGMDGVPYISFPPIQPGTTFTYRFPIRQSGTYWYHSHTHLQEQRGVYGAIVIQPKNRDRNADREHVVLFSDWTNDDPHEVLRNLRRGSEFFGIRKHSSQSLLGAAKTGKIGAFLGREAMRMPAMDLADVAYDAFLTNGKHENVLTAKPGETIRLRVIDGSASTFFHLHYAGGPMTIVGADGQPVEPVKMMKPILIGVAETYDVLVKVPAPGAYELRATAHDGSGHSSLWIGSGERKAAGNLPMPFVYDTMMGFNWKIAFAPTPAGTMGMPDHDVDGGKFDKPGMNMDMDMGGMSQDGSMKMPMATKGMDHSAMDMSDMDHGEMNDPAMDHSKMKMGMNDMPSMPAMDSNAGVKHNQPKWYDFLLREDAARASILATDSMMSKVRPFPPYKMLRAVKNTSFPKSAPRREFRLTLDGDMNRYVWTLNNRPLAPEDDLHIREGEVVRFIMINRTMMHHPMHLHGHFFRVINGQGDHSPLKHTVDVAPMTTVVIEFMANEPGDWFFHCHLLYHMMSGMARVVKYEGFTPAPATQAIRDELYKEASPVFFYGHGDLLSNMTQGDLTVSSLLHIYSLEWEAGWNGVEGTNWETELTYGRYFNRFTTIFAGLYAEGNDFSSEDERLITGIRYLLPGNFQSSAWIDSEGEVRIKVMRELMLTPRIGIFGEVEFDTREHWSYQAGLSYTLTKSLSATALWDSHYGVGAGLTVRF
jgi:FtsP/CotA-like multicopper oxidase with cupredoxin domain